MGDRRRQHSIYEVIHSKPLVEERKPEVSDLVVIPSAPATYTLLKGFAVLPRRRKTVTIEETRVHRRNKQSEERSRSRSRSRSRTRYRQRVPTPSPPRVFRVPSPPPRRSTFTMSPKDSPTTKPFVPLPKPLPVKKDEDKAKKQRPGVTIFEGHKKSNSDTVYSAGLTSPWSLEERSPLDYSPKSKSQSPRPSADKEVYEVINGQTVVRKYPSKRGESTYITRRPKTPKDEDFELPAEVVKDGYKDRYKEIKATTKVLQQALADETEKARWNHDQAKEQEALRLAEIESLQMEIGRLRLEKRMSDSKAADAEKKYKLAEIERLEEKERELQRREREFELEKKQWKEIEASPSPVPTRRSTLSPIVSQAKPDRRSIVSSPYVAGTVAAQPPQTLISGNAGLEAIFEAQRDDDRRKVQESRETKTIRDQDPDYITRVPVRETGRSNTDYRRPRREERYK